MRFLDEIELHVQAGNGGNGAVSFRREKFVPRGGPDGGDGGVGGSVVLVASSAINTLYHLYQRKLYKAEAGRPGGKSRKTGRGGNDISLEVPLGTIVTDDDGNEIVDLTQDGERFVLARGGGGGAGNYHFRSASRQAPSFAKDGQPGEQGRFQLEVKLIADVGLIGYPNVGKSTLINAISASKSKIGQYPFTTKQPHLAVLHRKDHREPIVLADLPGLIDGAHEGAGLGLKFLRHAERTRLFVHLLTVEFLGEVREKMAAINEELAAYNPSLKTRPQLVALNKIDLVGETEIAELVALLSPMRVFPISAKGHIGLDLLVSAVQNEIDRMNAPPPSDL